MKTAHSRPMSHRAQKAGSATLKVPSLYGEATVESKMDVMRFFALIYLLLSPDLPPCGE